MKEPGIPPFAFVQALIFIWLLIERIISYYRNGRKIAFWSVISTILLLVAICFLGEDARAVVIVYSLVLIGPVWSFILALTHQKKWIRIVFSILCFPLAAIPVLVVSAIFYTMIFGKS